MNPALKKLGYGPEDRVVIIHTDDIGTGHAANAAFADLWACGGISSGAVIVPGPWFLEAAEFCRDHPDVDMGVHLTLNAEFGAFRWGPISTRDPASGLLDAQGYFPRSIPEVREYADPGAVAIEMRAQLDRALAEGIDVTHIDSHKGTVIMPPFIDSYLALAQEYRLPMLFPNFRGLERSIYRNYPPDVREAYRQRMQLLEEQGVPLFDLLALLPLGLEPHTVETARQVIDSIEPGLTMLLLHPLQDTPEARAMTRDWPARVSNYQACMSEKLHDHVRDSGVHVIGYRALRDLIRK